MPPVTPSTIRFPSSIEGPSPTSRPAGPLIRCPNRCDRPVGSGRAVGRVGSGLCCVGHCLGLGLGVELDVVDGGLLGRLGPDDLVLGDLLETDRERLAGDRRHLRRDHVAEAVTELVEVRVDVARPPGGKGDQGELGVDLVEERLDRRVDHRVVFQGHSWSSLSVLHCARAWSMIANISSTVASRSSLTTTWSARSRPTGSSTSAFFRRACTLSSGSPRPRSRRSCYSREGGSTNSSSASGCRRFTCCAPSTSISSTRSPSPSRRVCGSGTGLP